MMNMIEKLEKSQKQKKHTQTKNSSGSSSDDDLREAIGKIKLGINPMSKY